MRFSKLAVLALVLGSPTLARADLIGGGAMLVGLPQGDFDRAVGTGWGFEGHGFATAPKAPWGLRFQGSFLIYGSESFVSPYPGTRGRVGVEVTTDNWIASLAAGPQLAVRSGPLRPYVHALAGFSYFATTSRVDSNDVVPFAESTNYDDWTFRWSVGGGVNIPIGGSVALDLGVAYVSNDRVSYLTEGDLVEDAAGSVVFAPRRSEANLVQFTVGVSAGW